MGEPDDASLTPEQKLLKLIESQEKIEQQQGAATGQATSTPSARKGGPALVLPDFQTLLSPAVLLEQIQSMRARTLAFFAGTGGPLELGSINRVARLLIIMLSLYLVYGLWREYQTVNMDYSSYFEFPKTGMAEVKLDESRKFSSTLFEEMTRRNVFVPQEQRGVEQVAGEVKSELSAKILEMSQQLKLAGISVNPDNPARTFCMIEDLQKNMTSFLREGDTIAGMTVTKINANGVILKHQDSEIELK